MRSIKTTGGLTRGRGMTETQRLVWLLSAKACSEINLAMQNLTALNFTTSEQHNEVRHQGPREAQHKDVSEARMKKKMADTRKLVGFLTKREPFNENPALQNIVTNRCHRG